MDPLVLWQSLKDHFDGMKAAELHRAKFEWERLYFSNFSSATAYDSALRRIVSQLKLCDQEVTDEESLRSCLVSLCSIRCLGWRTIAPTRSWFLGYYKWRRTRRSSWETITPVRLIRGRLPRGKEDGVGVGVGGLTIDISFISPGPYAWRCNDIMTLQSIEVIDGSISMSFGHVSLSHILYAI